MSLVAQLILTTRDTIKFLREFQDSPEELRSTVESLVQFHNIVGGVKCLIEESPCANLHFSIASISNALKICESQLKSVARCVNKFKGVFDCRSRMRQKWESFKHVVKKGEMQGL